MRIFVNNIVKNDMGDTIGYDFTDLDNGSKATISITDIIKYKDCLFENAMFIGNNNKPYIKGKKALTIRIDQSNIVKMYHGSCSKIEKPQYGLGKSNCDYGSGFYTTTDKQQADNWAIIYGGNTLICNKYQLDTKNLSICDLDSYGTLAWIAEVIYHRIPNQFKDMQKDIRENFCKKYRLPNINKYDVIYGYRADD